jgi:hypothetical protein
VVRLNEIRCANPDCRDGNGGKPKLFGELKNGNVLVIRSTEISFIPDNTTEIKILCGKCKTYTSILIE